MDAEPRVLLEGDTQVAVVVSVSFTNPSSLHEERRRKRDNGSIEHRESSLPREHEERSWEEEEETRSFYRLDPLLTSPNLYVHIYCGALPTDTYMMVMLKNPLRKLVKQPEHDPLLTLGFQ
ncbi:hypothetical protein EYF80_042779 [Liparis tanakae]|uniref:Uncharacterized protein n=1 Tax=Liparis tanakae TaxID=230148 RepID=A0A4Z2G0A5_9TELE|nr:hypothetical protein EYF80_042779 [Liparis tanakae]